MFFKVALLLIWDLAHGLGSTSSGFTRSLSVPFLVREMSPMTMYEKNFDPPSNGSQKHNMWNVLAHTEKWIAQILGKGASQGENPFTRKEISYICELSDDDALVVAGLWRRLREGREQCELHGQTAESFLQNNPESRAPTFRQTQVIVVPNDSNLNDWSTFDKLITTINSCRRNARDLVLDANLEKLDLENQNLKREWSVSVNCAHLHPRFGSLTKEEQLKSLQEEVDEVDVNLEEYKKKRLLARRSPYPTVCVEIRATPPPDFSHSVAASVHQADSHIQDSDDERVTLDDVKRLEALFGKGAAVKKEVSSEDAFWDAIGKIKGIQEVTLISPMRQAQIWVSSNHEDFRIETSTFTSTDCKYVDEAYEFVFNNIAMQQRRENMTQYLIYTNFVSSSATSFEKFAYECQRLIDIMPSLRGKLELSTLYPEHIKTSNRSPVPILVMLWK